MAGPDELPTDALLRLINHGPVVSFLWRTQGTGRAPEWASNNLSRLCGWPVKTIVGNPDWWLEGLHPEERDRVGEWLAEAPGVERQTLEYRFRHRDGDYRTIQESFGPVDEAARSGFPRVSYWREVGAREQERVLNRKIRTAVDAMSEGLALFDERDRLLYVNRKHRELFPSLAHLLEPGVHLSTLLEAALERQEFDAAKGREAAWIAERLARQRTQTGKVEQEFADGRWYLLSESRSDWGGVLGLRIDITEYKALETQLRHARELQALGKLTGGVAHDFNNRLAVILGNIELAQGELGERQDLHSYLEKAERAALRGATTVQRLLTFARQQVLKPRLLCVPELLEEIVTLLDPASCDRVAVRHDLTERPLFAKIDPGPFETAILDIFSNARESMPDGGDIKLRVSSVTIEDGDLEDWGLEDADPVSAGDYVEIEVADSGCGMDEAVRSQIFEPFFTTKGFGGGSGLSLSMVYGFVRQSNGYVTVDGTSGKGTVVKLYLPRADAPSSLSPELPGPPQDPILEAGTILVVEDDDDLRGTVAQGLRHHGFQVIEAPDGPSALERLAEDADRIDLVFTDMVMPNGMSGLDLVKQIDRDRHRVRIVLTSGYPDRFKDTSSLDLESISLLAKPYSLSGLAHHFRDLLRVAVPHSNAGSSRPESR